jgi:hypothetical protein
MIVSLIPFGQMGFFFFLVRDRFMGNIEQQLSSFHIFLLLGHYEVYYYIMRVKYSKKGLKGWGQECRFIEGKGVYKERRGQIYMLHTNTYGR